MVFFGKKTPGFSLWGFLYRNLGTIGIIAVSIMVFFVYMYLANEDEDKKNKKYKRLSKRDVLKSRKSYDYRKSSKSHSAADDHKSSTKIIRGGTYDSAKNDYSDDEYDKIEKHHRKRIHHHDYEDRHSRHMYDSD